MSSLCVTTTTQTVDRLRVILEELDLNDPSRRLKYLKEENLVAVPVRGADSDGLTDLKRRISGHMKCNFDQGRIDVRTLDLPVSKKLAVKSPMKLLQTELQNLVKKLGYVWTDDMMKDIPSHWEKHGDLVLLPETAFTLPVWSEIGTEAWLTVTKCLSCTRLARKCTVSVDQYRTPQVHMLYGTDTWVEHIDNGVRYTYDVTKCMFSAGNITEKLRVSRFSCHGEVVVDLYAGIGYFTLPYLVYTGVKHLHACEWNPDAVEALRRNLKINAVEDRCTIHAGDNKQVCPKGVADRVNLGLIPSSCEGWPVACAALRPNTGGILHIHNNVNAKPRADTDCNMCHNSEPKQTFRCEAKSHFSNNRISGQDSGNVFCKSQHSEINQGDKGLTNDSTDDKTNKTAITNDSKDGSNILEHDIVSVDKLNHLCKKTEDKVRNTKWDSWAANTAGEIKDMLQRLHHNEWTTNILHVEHVKPYAPYVDHIVLDLECRPCSFFR